MASCGALHTITLSNDGTLHSIGGNEDGQLGFGHNNDVSLPTPIPNLPKIKLKSCGGHFTVCVDHEGFIWSFGENDCGQLGTGNKKCKSSSKTSRHSSCSFCFLWIWTHIDHHK